MPRGKKTPDPAEPVAGDPVPTTPVVEEPANGSARPRSRAPSRARTRPVVAEAVVEVETRTGDSPAVPTGPSLVALGLQTSILHEQLAALQRQVAEITRQAEEARAAVHALHTERGQIARDIGELARQAREARQELEMVRAPAEPRPTSTRAASRPEPRAEKPPEESRSEEKAETPPAHPRNRLGVTVGNGVVVAEVLPDSPAAAAGVTRGDVIEEVDGHGIVSGTQLRIAVDRARPTGEVRLKAFRAGATHEFRIPMLAVEGQDSPSLGITVGPGVVVAAVQPDTPAATAGLATGDVIDELNGKPVHSGDELRHAVHHLFDDEEAVLRVTRAGEVREVRAGLAG